MPKRERPFSAASIPGDDQPQPPATEPDSGNLPSPQVDADIQQKGGEAMTGTPGISSGEPIRSADHAQPITNEGQHLLHSTGSVEQPHGKVVEMRGMIYDTNSVDVQTVLYGTSTPWDPRASGMEALDKMICWNLGGSGTPNFRPWICVNSGTPRSGKTTLLNLSCNRFVSSDTDALFAETGVAQPTPRPRHAIFITMNGSKVKHHLDANDAADIRLYHRILFAVRGDRNQTWEDFMAEVRAGNFGRINDAAVVREIRKQLPDAHVLIAADELRALAPDMNVTDREKHAPAEECKVALTGLNELVRQTYELRGEAHIFLVASALSVVDLEKFSTESSTPFTFQPLEPVEPVVLRDMFQTVGINPTLRRLSEEDLKLATGILKHSTEMGIMMALHQSNACLAHRAQVLAAIAHLDRNCVVDFYLTGVHGGVLDTAEKVHTVYSLLHTLFTTHPPQNDNDSFNLRLHPALDAMCYGVCRVIRKNRQDAVLMRPDVMKELCDAFLKTREELRPALETAFVVAVREFAEALTEAVLAPGETNAARRFVDKVGNLASSPSKGVLEQLLRKLKGFDESPILNEFVNKLTAVTTSNSMSAKGSLIDPVKKVAAAQQTAAVVQESFNAISKVASSPTETFALGELASLLAAVAASMGAGKTFEGLIKSLFRCLLLSGRDTNLKDLFELPPNSAWDSAVLEAVTGECPDVPFITAFPRAYNSTRKINKECDSGVLDLVGATNEGNSKIPCVFQPTDPYNLLLDVAVIAKLASGDKVCLGLQCKEWSAYSAQPIFFNDAVKKWRDRDQHLTWNGTKQFMEPFMKEVKILWVLVTVNNPLNKGPVSGGVSPARNASGLPKHGDFTLMADEALLSLDAARRWCPSLQFASSASAAWSPGELENHSV